MILKVESERSLETKKDESSKRWEKAESVIHKISVQKHQRALKEKKNLTFFQTVFVYSTWNQHLTTINMYSHFLKVKAFTPQKLTNTLLVIYSYDNHAKEKASISKIQHISFISLMFSYACVFVIALAIAIHSLSVIKFSGHTEWKLNGSKNFPVLLEVFQWKLFTCSRYRAIENVRTVRFI